MIKKRADSIAHSYEEYPFKDKPRSKKYLTKREYRDIIQKFLENVAYRLITTGDKIVLPSTLGALQIVKFRNPKWRPIDYKTTDEVYGEENKNKDPKDRKIVRHTNAVTDGYWVKVHWYKNPSPDNKYGARFKYSRSVAFKLTRPNVRPNSYNKWNPEVSLYPYFKEVGHERYKEL